MRTIAHLSDLHFGRIDAAVLAALERELRASPPDVLVVSGDLTQRARPGEFAAAREFLSRFDVPQVVVPGNHDVPLYDLRDRFGDPYGRWRAHFAAETEPAYEDDEIQVVGLNTARAATFKGGRVNRTQVERLRERLLDGGTRTKAIVSHHPFDLPAGRDPRDLVGRAHMAMEVFAAAGADLFLSGHLHDASVGSTAARYRIAGHAALVVHAGTTTSTRLRLSANSYNRIVVAPPRIAIERRAFDLASGRFAGSAVETFERGADGWRPADAA